MERGTFQTRNSICQGPEVCKNLGICFEEGEEDQEGQHNEQGRRVTRDEVEETSRNHIRDAMR